MKVIDRRLSTAVVFACALVVLVAAVGWRNLSAQTAASGAQVPAANMVTEFMKQYEATPRVTVPVPRGNAAVLVVKFSDYECPGCGVTYRAYKPILEKYETQFPGAVKYVVKDFPLDQSCATWMQRPLHTASCDAAVAVVLARAHNHGPEMEDWFYSNQQLLTHETVRKAAGIIGNVSDFDAHYAEAINQVKADIGLGRLLNVDSTPTFFINGVKIAQVLRPELFDAAIAYELKKAGKMK